jgi:hypothetical protein
MRIERAVFGVTALAVFAVFCFTSAPGLGLVDSGELTTVAATLSIAHPTGYPLWTMLGRLWQSVLPLSVARAMVLFSAMCAAIACGVLSVCVFRMVTAASGLPAVSSAVVTFLLACAFAFSSAIWSSVAFAEVYPLTLLIASLLVIAALSQVGARGNMETSRAAAIACYLWGLGFGSHFTILWLFPIIAWLVFRAVKSSEQRNQSLAMLAGLFALGATVNLFLPIRSSVEPLLDWSDPQSLPGLLRHLTAWQYRVWMFKGNLAGFASGFVDYLSTVPQDMGWPLFLLTILGTVRAVARRAWVMLLFLLVWLIGVAYNLNYSIPDISTYFVAFYAPLFLLAVYGFVGVILRGSMMAAGRYRPALTVIIALIIVSGTAIPASRTANHRHDTFATDHALAVLETLPDSALVFQGNWDIQSPVIYLQTVEKVRTDVVMLDLALIQRPWYIKQERRRHPQIFAGAEHEITAFQKAVAPFESGAPYNGSQIETAYVAMINRLVENSYRSRPVYIRDTRNVGHPDVAAKFPSLPAGYFIRIQDERVEEPMLKADRLLNSKHEFDEREQYLLRQAAIAAAMQGSFAMDLGDTARVREAARLAATLAPNDQAILRFIAQAKPFLSDTSTAP